jgi:hypothetical protein
MKRSRRLYLLSPGPLVAIAWLFTIAGVTVGYVLRDSLPVMARTMSLNGFGFHFPITGMIWIGLSLLMFLVLSLAATRPLPRTLPAFRPADLSLSLRLAALVHAFIVLVVVVWVLLGARSVGGFDRLIALAAEQETIAAREAILDNKLFPGMRLLYTGLGCLGVLGSCVFAVNIRSEDRIRNDMLIGLGMFLVSVVVLSILPIFLSQRILLIHMVLSTFVAVSLVSGRLFHVRYGLVLMALLLTVWSLREAVTVGEWASEHSSARIGLEKLIYYLVNDFYNAVIPFSTDFPHTFGLISFNFIVDYSPFSGAIYTAGADRLDAVHAMSAGGAYPALTAPYVDFSWMGIALTAALALVFSWVFNRAQRSFAFAVVYGQIGGALLLGPHSAWYSNPNFTFNILLTLLVCAFIRRPKPPLEPRVGGNGLAQGLPSPQPSDAAARAEPWRRGRLRR